MKIRSVKAELFHADGQTDRRTDLKKLETSFRNFRTRLKRKKNESLLVHI